MEHIFNSYITMVSHLIEHCTVALQILRLIKDKLLLQLHT